MRNEEAFYKITILSLPAIVLVRAVLGCWFTNDIFIRFLVSNFEGIEKCLNVLPSSLSTPGRRTLMLTTNVSKHFSGLDFMGHLARLKQVGRAIRIVKKIILTIMTGYYNTSLVFKINPSLLNLSISIWCDASDWTTPEIDKLRILPWSNMFVAL